MRILAVNNLFPPFAVGGYETRCAEACAALTARGHSVEVLVGDLGAGEATPAQPFPVHRELTLIGHSGRPWRGMPGLLFTERGNRATLRRHHAAMRADVTWIWNLGGLGRSLVAEASALGPVALDVSDHWLLTADEGDPWIRWCRRHPWLARMAGRFALSSAADLPLAGTYFTSTALRDLTAQRLPVIAGAPIIYCGIDTVRWNGQPRAGEAGVLRCLYAGRLHPDKGVRTACRAFSPAPPGCTLTVAGAGDAEYERALRQEFAGAPHIAFVGRLDAERLAGLMREHDCLIFPSEWAEPFALAPLEASAAGLSVIGTLTGGTGEFLVDGVTGLAFTAGDPQALRACMIRLRDDAGLRLRLSTRAAEVVRGSFTMEVMVERMERHLADRRR